MIISMMIHIKTTIMMSMQLHNDYDVNYDNDDTWCQWWWQSWFSWPIKTIMIMFMSLLLQAKTFFFKWFFCYCLFLLAKVHHIFDRELNKHMLDHSPWKVVDFKDIRVVACYLCHSHFLLIIVFFRFLLSLSSIFWTISFPLKKLKIRKTKSSLVVVWGNQRAVTACLH